jgi:hypothetical protein
MNNNCLIRCSSQQRKCVFLEIWTEYLNIIYTSLVLWSVITIYIYIYIYIPYIFIDLPLSRGNILNSSVWCHRFFCRPNFFFALSRTHPQPSVVYCLHHLWSFPLGLVRLECMLHKLWKVSLLTISGRKHLANGFGETFRMHTTKITVGSFSDEETAKIKTFSD